MNNPNAKQGQLKTPVVLWKGWTGSMSPRPHPLSVWRNELDFSFCGKQWYWKLHICLSQLEEKLNKVTDTLQVTIDKINGLEAGLIAPGNLIFTHCKSWSKLGEDWGKRYLIAINEAHTQSENSFSGI